MRPIFLFLTLSALHATPLLAQSVPVQTGDRVKLQSGSLAGRFTVVDVAAADTLVLRRDADQREFRVAAEAIEQIARQEKRTRGQGLLRGGGIGLLVGAVGGAVLGFADGDDRCDPNSWCFLSFSAEDKALMGAIALGGGGALIGGTVGLIAPGQRWVGLPVPGVGFSRSRSGRALIGYAIKL